MSKTPKTFKVSKTRWNEVVLVCRKCSKKLDGGFGPDGDKTLKKALRRYLHAGKSRKDAIYAAFNSYTERSPSGQGVHRIVRGTVPTGRRR